jgi:membrane protein
MAILNGKKEAHNGSSGLPRGALLVWFRFGRKMIARFLAHGGLERAGSLAYTTLLSLVPLMTVVFAILTAFPVGEQVNEVVQEFIFSNFMPASGEVVHRYLLEFADKASHLSGLGFVVLIVVAVMLVASIDHTFNAIWEVERRRGPLNKFLVYWAVISLGPLLVGASLLATSFLVSLPVISEATATGLGKRLLGWLPVLMSAMAFGLIYWLVPNRPVNGWHALVGGVFAAVLFEWAKQGFAWYLTTFPTYEVIYGALATIPIFLVWLYVSWIVVLLGAEFTYGLGAYRHLFTGREAAAGELEEMVQILLKLARGQKQGRATPARELIHCCGNAERLLAHLQELQLVDRNERGQWLLTRAVGDVTLHDLYRVAGERLPEPGEPSWPRDPRLAEIFAQAHQVLSRLLDVPLSRLLEAPPA